MIVSLLGLVISLFAYLIAFPQPYQRRFDVYGALLSLHIVATIAYWLLSFESGMDAFMYYRDPFGFYNKSAFVSGTYFIVHLVQSIRSTLGGSFLDHFLFFQCFGMISCALIMRSFNDLAESFGTRVPLYLYATLFLPGLHFWSAGIGKDGPMIMAVSLALWSAMRLDKRVVWMAIALTIMMLIRPHIAGLVVGAITFGLLFSKQLNSRAKIVLAPVAMIGFIFVAARAGERFNVSLDAESFSNFVETQQSLGDRFGSGADLSNSPLPIKVLSLLFRPFYFDADGMMGWAASVENTVLLAIFGYIAYHWRLLLKFGTHVFYVSYSVAFSGALIILLAMVNYNVGLGQRQKMMAVPPILLIFASIALYKRYLAAHAQTEVLPAAEQLSPAIAGA